MQRLRKRTQSDKVLNLKGKAFEIANNPKYDGCQRRLASMVYKFFDKKSKGTGKLNKINNQLMNFMSQLLGNLKKEKCILLLKAIFGVLI